MAADIDHLTEYVQEMRARRRAENTPREGVTPSRVIHTCKGPLYCYDE